MSWVNVGRIKGDTGATGSDGGSAYIILDSAHGIIYLGDANHDYQISLSSCDDDRGRVYGMAQGIPSCGRGRPRIHAQVEYGMDA